MGRHRALFVAYPFEIASERILFDRVPQIVEITGNGAGAREGAMREVDGQSAEKTDTATGPAPTYLPAPRLGKSRPFSFAQAIAVS